MQLPFPPDLLDPRGTVHVIICIHWRVILFSIKLIILSVVSQNITVLAEPNPESHLEEDWFDLHDSKLQQAPHPVVAPAGEE